MSLKQTPVLFGKPSLLHRIVHHPDPLTSQQTQRFLEAVTTSFRKNLDQEHGWLAGEDQPSNTASSEPQQRRSTPAAGAGHDVADRRGAPSRRLPRRPTDHHFSSILSNPLFSPVPGAPTQSGTERDPMDVFDGAVSKGLMTLDRAAGILQAKYKIIKSQYSQHIESPSAIHEVLSNSGVSDRVLSWLQSSGMARTLEFVHHPRFTSVLMLFLVPEGKEPIVWDWISRLLSDNGACDSNTARTAGRLLKSLIRTKTFYEPIDSSIESILQASETYRCHPGHVDFLGLPWRTLASRTATLAPQKPPASASLFDAYLGLAKYFKPLFVRLPVAHLHLHHPATPTHDRALEYFDDVKSGKEDCADLKDKHLAPRETAMAFDTVHHLSLIGKFEEAESLMTFVKSRYPDLWRMCPDGLLDYLEYS